MYETSQRLVTSASDLPTRTIKFRSVVFDVTLRLLVINISSPSPAINKRRRYSDDSHQLATVRKQCVYNT